MGNILELKGKCTGCAACAIVCPTSAITMILDEEGFISPRVNSDLCVDCGICQNVCSKEAPFKIREHLKIMALQAKDKSILNHSSSGGAAAVISRSFVEEGGYVLGSYFDDKTNRVETKCTNQVSELELFSSSKYLQANFFIGLSLAISKAKEDRSARFLLFGTPCQIYGASKVCEFYNIKDQFYFVDFFCHGVPTYHLWKRYLLDKGIDIKSLQEVSFRNKSQGWHSCFALQIKDDTQSIISLSGRDDYYQAYFDNVFLMESCYDCKFRAGLSCADIRLGDYWGKRYIDNEEGVSSAIAFTEDGMKLLSNDGLMELDAGEDVFDAQSTKPYEEIKYRHEALHLLRLDLPLRQVIRRYRKLFPFKRRAKLWMKGVAISILPSKAIKRLRVKKWRSA